MRVVAGTAGGRRLVAPPGGLTRPTADRVKEALFSALGDLDGASVLDLYAGSGALAVEALSRGAAAATLVESDRRAIDAIRRNLETAGVGARARVIRGDAARVAATHTLDPFDVVLADPPYRVPLTAVLAVLGTLRERGALRDGARVVVERDRRAEPVDAAAQAPPFLAPRPPRAYGDTVLRWYDVEQGS